MKKSDLIAKTVVELKALAQKKKVSLSAGGTKADIINAIMALPKAKEPAAKKTTAKKTAVSAKPTAKKTVKAKKSTSAKKPAMKKRAAKKAPAATTPVREWKLPPGIEEPLMAQERVSESKYYTGPSQQPSVATSGELPHE